MSYELAEEFAQIVSRISNVVGRHSILNHKQINKQTNTELHIVHLESHSDTNTASPIHTLGLNSHQLPFCKFIYAKQQI